MGAMKWTPIPLMSPVRATPLPWPTGLEELLLAPELVAAVTRSCLEGGFMPAQSQR